MYKYVYMFTYLFVLVSYELEMLFNTDDIGDRM
jgi:hypothetical protein